MKLILLGAPGAGKGTQAEIVCDKLNIPAISTGNILREAMKNETEMGVKAKAFIDSGALVPDDVIIGIIKERLAQDDCKNGFILDGVPRTVAQAEALEEMGVGIDKVVDIEVSDERIIQRLSGRRVCSACGASYHTTAKPSVKPDVCDRCGGALIVRKDDESGIRSLDVLPSRWWIFTANGASWWWWKGRKKWPIPQGSCLRSWGSACDPR